MILDSPQSRLIVFGGFGGYGTPGFLNDRWQLPLAPNPSWSLIGPTGAPPSPRDGHVAVFDSDRRPDDLSSAATTARTG